MNLTVVTQALVGAVVVTDPLRDREYKRARKSISEGIQGTAVGGALMVAAALGYYFLPREKFLYAASLTLALLGIILFFRNIGRILDAKIGPKLLDPALQPRGTGPLTEPAKINGSQGRRPQQDSAGASGRLPEPVGEAPKERVAEKRVELAAEKPAARPLSPPPGSMPPTRTGTGRISREHSTYLRGSDKPGSKDDILSKIRN